MIKNYMLFVFLIGCLLGCGKEEDPMIINSFEPTSGDYNTEVTIKGAQFNTSSNTVFFGSQRADIVSAISTEIVAKVPVGAVTGKIKVTNGNKQAISANDFTVTSGSWTKKANFTNLSVNGLYDLSFSIGNKAYVHASSGIVNGIKKSAELWEYNSSTNTWTKKKELHIDQTGIQATAFGTLDKGYILQYQALWEYNPTNDQWAKKNALPIALNTDQAFGAFYITSANIVIIPLFNGDWFTYNPTTDTWGRNLNAPFSLSNSRLYQGGQTKGFLLTGTDVWEYNSSTTEWIKLPSSFPSNIDSDYIFVINDEVYIGASREDNLWVYKPSLNKWVQKSGATGQFRDSGLYFSMNNKGYLGMGVRFPEQYYSYDFYEFNP